MEQIFVGIRTMFLTIFVAICIFIVVIAGPILAVIATIGFGIISILGIAYVLVKSLSAPPQD